MPYLKSYNSPNRHGDADFPQQIFCEYSTKAAKQEMILGVFLSSWQRDHIQDTLVLSPCLRKRVQTSSRPSISDKYRKDLNWAELWGSGAGPTSISRSCWWPGAEGKLSIQYCVGRSGCSGGLRLVWGIISVAHSALHLLSFRLLFGMASIRAGEGRGSRSHTCHGGGGGNSCGPTQHH